MKTKKTAAEKRTIGLDLGDRRHAVSAAIGHGDHGPIVVDIAAHVLCRRVMILSLLPVVSVVMRAAPTTGRIGSGSPRRNPRSRGHAPSFSTASFTQQ